MLKILALLLLATSAAACARITHVAWSGPGWYLEKPHVIITGVDWYAGPMSYDDCEIARKKEASADFMLCVNEIKKPE